MHNAIDQSAEVAVNVSGINLFYLHNRGYAFVALFVPSVGALSQDANLEQQILKALVAKPVVIKRGLTVAPADNSNAPEKKFLATVKGRSSRSITLDEREHIADVAKDKPSIDVEINFDYRSADIGPAALPAVTALGKALSNADLKDSTIVIAGHTDSVGGIPYNQDLSERRADSIKRYLVEHFRIPADNLVTVGYGKSKPKSQKNPAAPENRRAQIVNME
jgi:outer membrane protein OmpA-like peptidoglycan-associated protein